MQRLSQRALNRALLARQLLLRRENLPVEAALECLLGLQAQAPLAPYIGLWSRLQSFDPSALGSLVADGQAVRLPLFRATVHLVTRSDGRQLRPLLQPVFERAFRSTPYGKNLAGLDLGDVAATGQRLLTTPLARAELGRALASRFPGHDALALAYAVTFLLPVVQVPPRGIWGQTGAVAWANLRRGGRVASAEHLILRYLSAFGPATAADFTAWSGLAGARELFDRLTSRLRRYQDEDGRVLFDVQDGILPDHDSPAPPRFLPEYDNALFSHAQRARILDGGHLPPLPPGNGARRGTVLIDGYMWAEWQVTDTLPSSVLRVAPYRALTAGEHADIEVEGNALLRFLFPEIDGREVEVVVQAVS